MNILVTGGLGFIGHGVVAQLETKGHNVVVVDNRTNYDILPKDEMTYLFYERLSKLKSSLIYSTDIIDATEIDLIFKKHQFDLVIHTASFPRQRVVNNNPALGSRTMIEGLLNLCESSSKWGVKRFVYVSSSMIYGNFQNGATEDWRARPKGQYAIMKLTGEHLVKDYNAREKFDYTIVRPSAVYGPLDVHDRVISRFMISALRGETLEVRGERDQLDFTYVDDTVDGIVATSLNENTKNQTYNITRGVPKTLEEAARTAIEVCGRGNVNIINRDPLYPHRGSLNIEAAMIDTEWKPNVDLRRGLENYRDWILSSSYWSKKL